jgi:hypothetical protein
MGTPGGMLVAKDHSRDSKKFTAKILNRFYDSAKDSFA